jgi:deoxyribodipyrimidine photo-lyase
MIIVWHENDLRISDNRALSAAVMKSKSFIPLFIYYEKDFKWPLGSASRFWLHHALLDLALQYKQIGGQLIIRKGPPLQILQEMIKKHGVTAVYFNLRLDPERLQRDLYVKEQLEKMGIEVLLYNSNHLMNPETFRNQSNGPYTVFTPFYNALVKTQDLETGPEKKLSSLTKVSGVASEKVEDLDLLDRHGWDKKVMQYWDPTREGAKALLKSFSKVVKDYKHDRDFPALHATSKMSVYLHFGQVSPREIIAYLREKESKTYVDAFIRQLVWREFGMYFLYHFPQTTDKNWREKFDQFPWKGSKKDLELWKKGQTGYPIVDAGMKELWETGWMHNRVRMIVASFLIKDLMIHWKEGALWFWDTLVDADLANNTLGWQWVAGSGPDASPFFRIFNPILQGEKFDPEGLYVKKYLPQLKNVPSQWIHKIWLAPKEVLAKADVELGEDYPYPIVEHDQQRDKALEAYKSLK